MPIRIFVFLIIACVFLSCNENAKLESEIADIELNFVVERFDKTFLEAKAEGLPKLKKDYPFLFSKNIIDAVWVQRMNDTLQKELAYEVGLAFPELSDTKGELLSLFQHLRYYDKTMRTPRVITLTNDVDYRNKTIVNDSLVLIALDNYLGAGHKFYQSFPVYIAANMERDQIVSNVAEGYAKRYVFQTDRKTLLDEMVYYGKLLYFKDIMIPFKTDAEKIGYLETQFKWAEANESAIWSYFIEHELLYSSDTELSSRFIANAPFSKFGLELDNESPGRLGQYIGWQIVKAYAKTTGENVMMILQSEPEKIFRKSKFKPKK